MNAFEAIPVLNELLRILCRSLPAYLADAKPWAQSDDQQLRAALDHLVADQQRYARRVAEAITAARRPARSRPLPHARSRPRTTSRWSFSCRR